MPSIKTQQKPVKPRQNTSAVHRLVRATDGKTLQERLLEFASANGHLKPDPDFPRFDERSYFRILRDWYEPVPEEHLAIDPNLKGKRMVEVQCICGTMMMLPYRSVNQFYVTSCGCREEKLAVKIAKNRESSPKLPRRMQDLRTSGPDGDGVHGYLKIVGWFKKQEKIYWEVDCVCGKRFNLTRGGFFHKQIDTCGATQCKSLKAQGYTREQARNLFIASKRANNAFFRGR